MGEQAIFLHRGPGYRRRKTVMADIECHDNGMAHTMLKKLNMSKMKGSTVWIEITRKQKGLKDAKFLKIDNLKKGVVGKELLDLIRGSGIKAPPKVHVVQSGGRRGFAVVDCQSTKDADKAGTHLNGKE